MNYRNITIDLSPKILPGHLVRRGVCGTCSHNQIADSVPLGREYMTDVKSVRWARLTCAGCGKTTDVRVCDVWRPVGKGNFVMLPEWFYFDTLDLGDAYKGPEKSQQWEPVSNNRLAPPVRLPSRNKVF